MELCFCRPHATINPPCIFLRIQGGIFIKKFFSFFKPSEILKKLQRIAIDGEKLGESFRKLGSHLSNAKNSYDDAEKRIDMLVDRVSNVGNLIDVDETKELK